MENKIQESIKLTKKIIDEVAGDRDKIKYSEVLYKMICTPGIFFGPQFENKMSELIKQLGREVGVEIIDEEEEKNELKNQTPPKPIVPAEPAAHDNFGKDDIAETITESKDAKIDEKWLKEKDRCLNRLMGIPTGDFVCRVCGSEKYRKLEFRLYCCESCSAVFGDPEKFALKPEDLQYRLVEFKNEDVGNAFNALYPLQHPGEMQIADENQFILSPRCIMALKVFKIPFVIVGAKTIPE